MDGWWFSFIVVLTHSEGALAGGIGFFYIIIMGVIESSLLIAWFILSMNGIALI